MTRSSQQTYIQRLGFQDQDRSNLRHGLACEYLFNRLVERDLVTGLHEKAQTALAWKKQSIIESKANLNVSLKSAEYYLKNGYSGESTHVESIRANLLDCKQKLDLLDSIILENKIDVNYLANLVRSRIASSDYVNVPISSGKFVNGFADVFLKGVSYLNIDFEDLHNLDIKWSAGVSSPECYGGQSGSVLGEVKITPEPAENIIQQIAFYRQYVSVSEVIILVDYAAPQLKRMTENSDIHVYRLGKTFEEWCSQRPQPEVQEF
tara:strand:+ start:497 stop:1288 length:792 start_codon:yes stop_codon:yes gene_type:complete